MARYEVVIKPSAVKELRKVARKKDRQRITAKIADLAQNPRPEGSRKLYGQDRYRIRYGDYRVLYSIEDVVLVVYVIKVGHRKNVYRSH